MGIDFIGPLTITPHGNKYILTIVDYFTKWAEAAPLKTKEANGVVSVLFEVIIIHVSKDWFLILFCMHLYRCFVVLVSQG